MRLTSVLAVVLFGSAVALGCSSSNNSGGGGSSGGGGGGGACTESTSGTVVGCFSWGSGVTASESAAFCPTSSNGGSATYAEVSSCPTANVAGTCTYNYTASGANYTYSQTYYAVNGLTCAELKPACTGATVQGTVTTSWTGC